MLADRLNSSLDDIIHKNSSISEDEASTSYDRYKNNIVKDSIITKDNIEIVFLISWQIAGVIIGKGGDRIRQLISLNETYMSVSSPDDFYPGTDFRYIRMNGSYENVCNTIAILWELIGLEKFEILSLEFWPKD